ncbi:MULTISPECIES: LysR family transcriptional regulator [unclassified Burkholderia]|uniref:LysR family transcriptional regulator n=1 Tax=unclassified Burkholderia TaxID=2613784 RepID=UPI001E564E39|nr:MULTISPECIES: LysR family transcriptional regulator [unclassified Burkholderia]UEP29612.1 LysR family transcriptional regulator [Burkholderia sp. B21-007]UEP45074.1 LysR family transcriptional regulator [Burkholderia sp. B21-005]
MDLNDVRIFVSVVQTGSLSGAAARLAIPLPTVSRRIRALEQQLRVQLLERTRRGTKPTEAGARLYEHASRGVELLAEGEEAVVSDQARLKGRLRLSLPPGFDVWWTLLSSFRKQYPDIQLHAYATERRVDLIEDGIDVALRVGAIAHESMVARQLLTYRHVLVASAALLDTLGVPKAPDDLHRFPCAVWSPVAGISRGWRLGEQTFESDPILSTNDYMYLRSRAIAGEVITELPPFLAAEPVRDGRLVLVLPSCPLPEQQVNLLYPSHRHPSAIVRAYLAFCQSQIPWFTRVCTVE